MILALDKHNTYLKLVEKLEYDKNWTKYKIVNDGKNAGTSKTALIPAEKCKN